MKNILKFKMLFFASLLLIGCSETDYEMGDLSAPTKIVVDTEIIGQDEANPYGDGSGEVKITVTADNAIAYKIDYGTTANLNMVPFSGQTTKRYTQIGVNTYTLTIVAYGPGGTATNFTHDLTVESKFSPDPEIISALTGDGSKTWVVDNSTAGHFGVGPWTGSVTDEWWSAPVDAKVESDPCFYSTTFTFMQVSEDQFRLDVDAPEGAFSKRGEYSYLPQIPESGDSLPGNPDTGNEGCYGEYTGGSSEFTFGPSTTGLSASTPSTQTSINLVGNDTYIGYGALQKEYEILEITPGFMYLRVQGTNDETGNAWYLKLVPAEEVPAE